MSQVEEMKLEAILSRENLKRAWAAVKRNDGAAGVDRKTIHDTKAHLKQHWPGIREKVVNGSYQQQQCEQSRYPKQVVEAACSASRRYKTGCCNKRSIKY